MIRNNITIMVIIALSLMSLSCEREAELTAPQSDFTGLSRMEAQVVANCLTVQTAAEEFALLNKGYYPSSAASATPCGDVLYELLPGRRHLDNPYNRVPYLPVFSYAGWTCETGYVPEMGGATPVGYRITGVGKEPGVTIFSLSNIESRENANIMGDALMFEVEVLVDRFVDDNDDVFPLDLDSDRNLAGNTVFDLIGSRLGGPMINSVTGEPTEPRLGTAYEPGSIAYAPILDGDAVVGGIITAVGETAGELIVNRRIVPGREQCLNSECRRLQKALLRFAWRNNMEFPDDVTADTDLTGRTLSDYFPYYTNYYVYDHSPLLDGTAHNPGEIAYLPVVENGVNSGYIITGAGKTTGVIIASYEYDLSRADKAVYNTGSLLRTASLLFAERNKGEFAVDLDTDRNEDGKTLLDLVPGRIRNFNPVSSRHEGIVDGAAAYPGETGYEGWKTGFKITSINEAGFYIIDYRWRPSHMPTIEIARDE